MKKKLNKNWSIILFIIIFLAIGFLIGYIEDTREIKFNIEGFNIIGKIILIIIFLFISIIIHELGHLIGGLMTGYKFLSFRIGNLMLIYDGGKFRLVEYSIVGTGGQCLMRPPVLDKNMDFPYKLYNLGGCILNIGVGILIVIFSFIFMKINIFIFGILNIFSGFINIIPMSNMVANDGLNQKYINESQNARLYFWKTLKINELLFNYRFKDMDSWLFEVNIEDNPISQGIAMAKVNRLMDLAEYEKARELCEEILLCENSNMVQKNELVSELIYLNIILENQDRVQELYSKDMEEYIKRAQKYFISKKRLLYSYYLIMERDFDKATIVLEEYNKIKMKYPYKGEVLMEDELIYKANKIYENLI